jgi:hypothetical protein
MQLNLTLTSKFRPVLNICIPYTSRMELVRGLQSHQQTKPNPKSIHKTPHERATKDPQALLRFSQSLGVRDRVDLMVRTSGERRLSDFLLWQVRPPSPSPISSPKIKTPSTLSHSPSISSPKNKESIHPIHSLFPYHVRSFAACIRLDPRRALALHPHSLAVPRVRGNVLGRDGVCAVEVLSLSRARWGSCLCEFLCCF